MTAGMGLLSPKAIPAPPKNNAEQCSPVLMNHLPQYQFVVVVVFAFKQFLSECFGYCGYKTGLQTNGEPW